MKIDVSEVIFWGIFLLYVFIEKFLIPSKLEKIKSELSGKLEEIKSSLSKEQFIHKLQFEKEFTIYEKLWANLIELKNLVGFFPLHDALKTKEKPRKEIEGKMIIKLMDNINNVQRTIENNRPFYSEEIYRNALKIVELTKTFFIPPEDLEEKKFEHLSKLIESESQIYEIIKDIEQAIRKRIENIGEAKFIG